MSKFTGMLDKLQKPDRSHLKTCHFPPWLAQIVTPDYFDRFWHRFGVGSESDDLSNKAIFRLDRARDNGRVITKSYIWVTLRHLAIDNYRKPHKEKSDENTIEQTPDLKASNYDDDPKTVLLKQLIQGLDLRDRVIINLRYKQKFTFDQIAMVIGFSESSARQECKRIEGALRARLATCAMENS